MTNVWSSSPDVDVLVPSLRSEVMGEIAGDSGVVVDTFSFRRVEARDALEWCEVIAVTERRVVQRSACREVYLWRRRTRVEMLERLYATPWHWGGNAWLRSDVTVAAIAEGLEVVAPGLVRSFNNPRSVVLRCDLVASALTAVN